VRAQANGWVEGKVGKVEVPEAASEGHKSSADRSESDVSRGEVGESASKVTVERLLEGGGKLTIVGEKGVEV